MHTMRNYITIHESMVVLLHSDKEVSNILQLVMVPSIITRFFVNLLVTILPNVAPPRLELYLLMA